MVNLQQLQELKEERELQQEIGQENLYCPTCEEKLTEENTEWYRGLKQQYGRVPFQARCDSCEYKQKIIYIELNIQKAQEEIQKLEDQKQWYKKHIRR